MVTVPNIVGMDITTNAPQQAVQAAGLVCGSRSMTHTGSTNYKITAQVPAAGESVEPGTSVSVTYFNSTNIPPPTVIWGH